MNSLRQILTPESIVNNNNNNDTYCLRWTRHPNMLSDALSENERSLQLSEQNRAENDSDTLLDVVIHLDDGSSLKLHSLVLAASSNLFQAIGQKNAFSVPGEPYHILLPDTDREDLLLVISFIYTGSISASADRITAITDIALTLGLSKLTEALAKIVKTESRTDCEDVPKSQLTQRVRTSMSPTFFERRSSERTPSPPSLNLPPMLPTLPTPPLQASLAGKRLSSSGSTENVSPNKKIKMESHPMLQSILSQFPLNPTLIQSLTGNLAPKEKDPWPGTIPFSTETPGYFAADLSQLEALEKLKSLKEASSLAGVAGSFGGNSQNQLANILTAAAKLKQVAEQATKSDSGQGPGEQSSGPGSRKLAFHEPRPCPVCRRVYRDAATLRTHTAIMHSEGAEPFRCSCGVAFGTKFEMYQHKKAGHPPVK